MSTTRHRNIYGNPRSARLHPATVGRFAACPSPHVVASTPEWPYVDASFAISRGEETSGRCPLPGGSPWTE